VARYTQKGLAARAEHACTAAGFDYGPHYEKRSVDGWPNLPARSKAIIGRVQLVHNQYYGYELEIITSEGGGTASLSGALNASEMMSFLKGLQTAAEHFKKGVFRLSETRSLTWNRS
jgi:hypothetical protein